MLNFKKINKVSTQNSHGELNQIFSTRPCIDYKYCNQFVQGGVFPLTFDILTNNIPPITGSQNILGTDLFSFPGKFSVTFMSCALWFREYSPNILITFT